jgi:Zn-dependent protease with chaperone function
VSKVDERVLGPGTTVRFALLLVLLVVASVTFASAFAGRTTESLDWACKLAAGWDPDAGDLAELLGGSTQQGPAYFACLDRYAPRPAWWLPLLGPVVLVGVSAALFFAIGARKSRRVVPLSKVEPDDSDVHEVLADLVAVTGLDRAPTFVVDPAATSTTGAVVFGRDRKPVVRLDVGLLVHRGKDPDGFRAVVLHELAHVHNRDVTLTYATVALWRVFLALALLPDTAWLAWHLVEGMSSPLWSSYAPGLARGIVLAVVMVLLVHLARADVLRTREVHADLTAFRWGANRRGWDAADKPSVGGAFAELWRTHPRWDLRRASLDDPAPLFGVRALPMFLTGAGAALINNSGFQYLKQYRIGDGWTEQVVALAAAGLVAGVAGIALWRALVHARLTGTDGPTGVLAGMWLGLGLVAGELVTGQHVSHDWVPARWWVMAVLVAAGVAFAWWIAQCARLWASTWRGRTLRVPMLLVLMTGGLVLSAWFAWWLGGGGPLLVVGSPLSTDDLVAHFQRSLPGAGPEWLLRAIFSTMPLAASVMRVPLLLAAVALAWVVPLLTWTVRPGPLRWVHEAIPDLPEPSSQALPSFLRVMLPGLVAGAVASAALIVARDLEELAFVAATFVAVAVAALLATLIAPSTHRLAASLAGAQIAAMIAIATGALVRSWSVLNPMITPGLVAAAVLAVAVAAARAVIHRLSRLRPRVLSSRRVLVRERRVAVAVLAVAALAFTGAEIADAAASRRIPDFIPTLTATSTPSPATTRMQVSAWNRVGGRSILDRVATATTCEAATAAAQEAVVFLRVPDPRLDPLWQGLITRTDRARTNCRTNPEAGLAWARQAAAAATALRTGVDLAARGDTPDTAVPEPAGSLNVVQWADRGARDLLIRFAVTAENLFDYLERVQGQIETPTLASYCTDLSRVARDGQGFFRVDDPWMQDRWNEFVEAAGKAGAHCTRALVDLDVEALRTALQEIQQQQRTAVCLEGRLRGSSKSGCYG